ncbi:MAG: PAS domain S-box protein [Chloroflexi bacterium]|nr:PAS domain S-box protein [Chloroflexota bacterium]
MSGHLVARGAGVGVFAALLGAFAFWIAWGADSVALGIVLAGGAVVIGAACGYFAFRESAQAVKGVSAAALRLAGGEMSERVAISGGPASELTRSFNSMARQLEELIAAVDADQARLRAVFDASTDAMVAVGADTVVRFMNQAAERVFGATEQSARGRRFIESGRDFELDGLIRRAVAASGPETTVITFGSKRIPLRAAAVPIRDGGQWAVLLILTDLTDVARVDQMRRDFLSNVSHELRTPLASIRALVETMVDGGVAPGEETEHFLGRIHEQVERLTTLVNELLDLSRIESGAVELHPEPIDAAALFSEAAALLRPRYEAEEITFELPPVPGPIIHADHASLVRVVSNLLDNAIKYSPRGTTVHAAVRDEGELVALEVRDEGPGIQPPDLPRVFERFYKGDSSRANSGVGLGLAIVKHVVRAHGGTVSAESPPNSGAVFTVRLPKEFVGQRTRPA